jgi:hypothetical protein
MPESERPANLDDPRDAFTAKALRALDEQLGPADVAALQAELAADVEKRRLFVSLCLQSQALLELLGPHRVSEIPDWTEREAIPAEASDPWETAGTARKPARGGRRRPWLPWTIAAAACLGAILATGVAWLRPWDRLNVAQTKVVSGTPPENVATSESTSANGLGFDQVAVVIQLDGARWPSSEQPSPAAGDILRARRLLLESGRVTLALLGGVVLTMEGPADLDLVSIDRVFCRRGKLRASVPKGAEGFVVASPASAVVDRGTEFAVNVDADGRSRVFVFEGVAEAALLDDEGTPKVTQIVERSQSFELDPRTGRIDQANPRPDKFVGAPKLATPSLALAPAYAAAVVASRPLSYWRFEVSGDGAFPNEIAGGPPLRWQGAVSASGGAEGSGCAVFKSGESDQCLYTDGLWELPRAPGHAVELWFLPDGIRDATLVGLYPPKDYLGPGKHGRFIHTFLLELTAHERGSLFKPASIRFLHRWPLDTRIGNNLVSERLYIPGRWHHVVAQKNGERLELFLDGELESVMPLQPDHPTRSCRLVVGRRNPDPLESRDERCFVGRTDELAVYGRPLTAEEVQHHYRLATTEEPAASAPRVLSMRRCSVPDPDRVRIALLVPGTVDPMPGMSSRARPTPRP